MERFFIDMTESRVYAKLPTKRAMSTVLPNGQHIKFFGYTVAVEEGENEQEVLEAERLKFIEALDNTLLLSLHARQNVDPLGGTLFDTGSSILFPMPLDGKVKVLHQFVEGGLPQDVLDERTVPDTIIVDFSRATLHALCGAPALMQLAQLGSKKRWMFLVYIALEVK